MKNRNSKQGKSSKGFNSFSSLKNILVAVNQSMEIEGRKPSNDRQVIKQAKAFVFEK